jgi:hypothetical protein
MGTLQQNIWVENDLTEQEKSCLNSNVKEQNVITNAIETDSTQSQCKDIEKKERRRLQLNASNRKWYWKKNKEQRAMYNKKRYYSNKVKHNKCSKEWKSKNREYFKHYKKQYSSNNKDKIRKYHTKYCSNRLKSDVSFKISCSLRTRLYVALKGNQKSGSAVKDLGCSITEFKTYISSKFQPGMTWDNYGKWHLDHIIPLSAFNLENRIEFLKACHYTNYQPLWEKDNIRKSNKLVNLRS